MKDNQDCREDMPRKSPVTVGKLFFQILQVLHHVRIASRQMSGDLPQAFERKVTTLVLNGRFDKDVHRLPVRGHSFLPCDRNLLVVETYSEWEDVIREKFDVTSMTGRDMFDFKNHFKNHLATFFKKSVTKNGEKMSITKCKILSFSVDYK